MITKLTIEEINAGVTQKKFSYLELIQAYELNFKKFECLNVAISEYWEDAKTKAIKLDQKNETSQKNLSLQNPLQGIPIAIKDMFLVKGTRTTAASKVLKNFVAPYESFTTAKLKDAGYIMPFKTNLDEFAMGSSNETSYFGATYNPWISHERNPLTPGGSSGGSAACVASYMSVAALGTDTGGSVRQPASFCGIVGFKATYGRCSRRGVVGFGSSLDQPAVFARNVQDACYVMETIAGHDLLDATSIKTTMPSLSQTKASVKGKKIGICFSEFANMPESYRNDLNNLLENLKNEEAIVSDVELPSPDLALKLYFIIAPAEAASNLARYNGLIYGNRNTEAHTYEEILYHARKDFGQEVKRRILIGNFVLNAQEYDKFFGNAIKIRAQIIQQMNQLFDEFDAILRPTTPNCAFAVGQKRSAVEMYREDLYTVLGNIYGGPAINVPFSALPAASGTPTPSTSQDNKFDCLKSHNELPIGIQIMTKIANEVELIEVAKKIEAIVDWKGWSYE